MSAVYDEPDWLRAAPTIDDEPDEPPPLRLVDAEGLEVPGADVELLGEFLEPEDRGSATLSALGDVEYVEDLVRPGRIVVVAGEEGSGKSAATTGEMAIRVAVAGGEFAGTWRVVRTGPVLVLSEMHPDDDYAREAAILEALGRPRSDLAGRLFRLPTLMAAGGPPPLTVAPWRAHVTAWMREHKVLVLMVDTATGATRVDPWGQAIQEVYASLRTMQDEYPALAIVLILHLKKPTGRGERRISDVLGEWSRWNDVTVLLEGEGPGAPRTKISTLKRVRRMRRIVATKRAGLLVDPIDADVLAGPKVPIEAVVAAIVADPGLSLRSLAAALKVSASTASKYVRGAEEAGLAYRVELGSGKGFRVFPAESGVDTLGVNRPTVSNTLIGRSLDGGLEGSEAGTVQPSNQPVRVGRSPTGHPTVDPIDLPIEDDYPASADGPEPGPLQDAGVEPETTPTTVRCSDYRGHAGDHVRQGDRFVCLACEPEAGL